MSTIEIERTISIAAPVDHVWDILANRFHEVGTWAAAIDVSGALPRSSGGTSKNDRVCDTPQGIFKERLTAFDEQARTFAYVAYEGLPGFVIEGGNTWWVKSLSNDRTEVKFRIKFDLKPVAGALMGWMLKRQMSKAADGVAADLKVYAETGKVSDDKAKAGPRIAQKLAKQAA